MYHVVFDIKIKDFSISGDHVIEASIALREIICTVLTITALNGLDVRAI